jgi:hypothetical protein
MWAIFVMGISTCNQSNIGITSTNVSLPCGAAVYAVGHAPCRCKFGPSANDGLDRTRRFGCVEPLGGRNRRTGLIGPVRMRTDQMHRPAKDAL